MSLKLYVAPGACSLAPHIALREAGAQFDLGIVDLATRLVDDGTSFSDVNAKGYVPALRLDDGQVLTENVAVLEYVASQHPAANLAPAEQGMEHARMTEWLCFINSELHKSFAPLFNPAAPEQVRDYFREHIARRFDYLESVLGDAEFVSGNGFTIADAYLFTVLSWCAFVDIDLNRWTGLARYQARLAERPSVQEALKAEGLIA